jgi:hypothetical protein
MKTAKEIVSYHHEKLHEKERRIEEIKSRIKFTVFMGRRGEKYSIKTVKEIVQYILEKESP